MSANAPLTASEMAAQSALSDAQAQVAQLTQKVNQIQGILSNVVAKQALPAQVGNVTNGSLSSQAIAANKVMMTNTVTNTVTASPVSFVTASAPTVVFGSYLFGPTSAWNTVSLAADLPSTSAVAVLTFQYGTLAANGGIQSVFLRTDGSKSGYQIMGAKGAQGSAIFSATIDLTNTQTFDWQATLLPTGSGNLTITLIGYYA